MLAFTLSTDLRAQAVVVASVGGVSMLVSAAWLLLVIRERPQAASAAGRGSDAGGGGAPQQQTPFLATMYALGKNRPYLIYLALRLWVTFAFHLPFFNRLNYLKYVMGFENAALANTVSALAAQLASFISLPLSLRAIQRFGKVRALVGLCVLATVVSTAFALIPPDEFKRRRLYALAPLVEGVTQVALYTIPESMLADVIDYDELVHGQRREGIFVVFDVNIMQLMDIFAATLPALVLSFLGYVGNAGCSCGCGSHCPAPYLRWDCPGDIGYACSSELGGGNPPFYATDPASIGNATGGALGWWEAWSSGRWQAPCTQTRPEVEAALQAYMYAIPAVCFVLATIFAARTPITAERHANIRVELERRARYGGDLAYDPVYERVITLSSAPDTAGGDLPTPLRDRRRSIVNALDSFSEAEQQLLASDEQGLQYLHRQIICGLLLAVSALVSLVVAFETLGGRYPKVKKLVAVFVLVGTVLFASALWMALKLVTFYQSKETLHFFANQQRFERARSAAGARCSSAGGGCARSGHASDAGGSGGHDQAERRASRDELMADESMSHRVRTKRRSRGESQEAYIGENSALLGGHCGAREGGQEARPAADGPVAAASSSSVRRRSRHASETSEFEHEEVESAAEMVAREVEARRAAGFQKDAASGTQWLGEGSTSHPDTATTRTGGAETLGSSETQSSDPDQAARACDVAPPPVRAVSVLAAAGEAVGTAQSAPPVPRPRPPLLRGNTTAIKTPGGVSDHSGQRQSSAGSSFKGGAGSSFTGGGSFGSLGERITTVSRNSSAGYGSSGAAFEPSRRISFTNAADRAVHAARNREVELMTREWLERARTTLEEEEQERRDTRASSGWGSWPWQS